MGRRPSGTGPADPDTGEPRTVLVRIPVTEAPWHGALPPVPSGTTVTVTVSDPGLGPDPGPGDPGDDDPPTGDVPPAGYRLVGVASVLPHGTGGGFADVLVTAATRERHPDWWRSLLDRASHVYDLRFGPVRHALSPLLAVHEAAAG